MHMNTQTDLIIVLPSNRQSDENPELILIYLGGYGYIIVDIPKKQDTGFPLTERDRLGLRGLLPPRVISFEQQYDRFSELTNFFIQIEMVNLCVCFCLFFVRIG